MFQTVDEVRRNLKPLIDQAFRDASDLTPAQIGRDGRVVVELDVMPNYMAASHYPEALFEATGVIPVGTKMTRGTRRRPTLDDVEDEPAKAYLVSAGTAELTRLQDLLSGTDQPDEDLGLDLMKLTGLHRSGSDDALRMGTGEVHLTSDGKVAFEAVLHPQLAAAGERDPAAEARILEDFDEYVELLGGSLNRDFATEIGGMWFVPLRLPSAAIDELAKFAQLRTLRPAMRIQTGRDLGENRYKLRAVPPASGKDSRRIAVFDGGVGIETPGLADWVSEIDHTGQAPLAAHREHGSAVTSAALFGSIDVRDSVSKPHTGVDHHRIWPLPPGVDVDGELAWILDQITKVVRKGDHRVAVITLAPALTVEDAEPHRWTATLDRLAFENDVLFVVSAGNNGELVSGLDRILVPADLVNGLSVGSCTSRSGVPVRDTYSSIGPGRPGAMTAPTGVQFGGNLDDQPFGALTADGHVGEHEGTSLAAPVVARACAEIDGFVSKGASANFIRTLAVHCADRPTEQQAEVAGSTSRDVGYGRFSESMTQDLFHRGNEVTILYEGAVKRRERLSLEVPIPDDVFEVEPTRRYKVRWTLGFFAPTEPSNPVDYSAAGIQVVFRPHADRFSATAPNGKPVGPEDLADPARRRFYEEELGWKFAEFPVPAQKKGFAPEVAQRQFHGKWEGVVRMDRNFNGSSLRRPRLDFHALVREGGVLQKDADAVPYVLAFSIEAPKGVEIYDRTRVHADLLTPLPVAVPIVIPGQP